MSSLIPYNRYFFLIICIFFLSGCSRKEEQVLPSGYENAPSTQTLTIPVGPNTFSIQAVVRNDRDGSLHFEDGAGNSLQETGFKVNSNFTDQAKWLDLVNIYLSLDEKLFDVLEQRVFDHTTHEMVTMNQQSAAGFDIPLPSVVQIRSCFQTLPDTVDLWMRAHSYHKDYPVYKLPPQEGSSVVIVDGKITIDEVQKGSVSYKMTRGNIQWGQSEGDESVACTVVFDFNGEWTGDRYQICAVSQNGNKVFPDVPHFIDFNEMGPTQVINFEIPYTLIDHFEIRPFGGRHRFYFEGLRLPKISPASLNPPPPVEFLVDGKEISKTSLDLYPIRVSLHSMKGEWPLGVIGKYMNTYVRMAPEPKGDVETTTSLIYSVDGLSVPACIFSYYDSQNRELDIQSTSHGSLISSYAASISQTAGFEVFPIPLNKIHRVKLEFALQ